MSLSYLRSAACVLLMSFLALPAIAASSCESLAALTIPGTTITSAKLLAAGAFSVPGPSRPGMGDIPGFCRVLAVASPVPDSEIAIEVWLPLQESWNGKFLGTGNGGYSSAMSYAEMAMALKKGYAVAGSNTGHDGGDLRFGVGHPEKIEDWGHRAVHVMTETARLITRNYYGRFPQYSYFSGCSTGGQQALTEAQRYPADYDGIVAGAPGNNRVRLNVGFLWSWLAVHDRSGADIFPAAKLLLIQQAVLASCDAADGLKDGLIGDPRRCAFDLRELTCQGGEDNKCLTPAQVEAVKKVYDGVRNPRTGERIYAGYARGSEAGWAAYFVGQPQPARLDFWRYWVFNHPDWDMRSFDFDQDAVFAEEKLSAVVANDPDLTAFKRRGGKLLMFHGWADPVVPPEDSIRYFESVQHATGAAGAASFFRLFMAPGMGHCYGGPGPYAFDALSALDQWVAKGIAPDQIAASHISNGKVDRTRPLCPHPSVAKWNGTGSIDEASSFVCVAPGR